MKFLVAMDSFKESRNQIELTNIVAESISEIFPDAQVLKAPLADGGEGTLDIVLTQLSGIQNELTIHNPLMRPIKSYYGKFEDNTIIIETAKAIGLDLLDMEDRNPLITSSYGVGELILDALSNNPKKIVITLGGSSTNDCGIGMLDALGARFYDSSNSLFIPKAETLKFITKIDLDNLDSRLHSCEIIAWTDVENPLYGPLGATFSFARQKGANQKQIDILEEGFIHISEIMKKDHFVDHANTPGAGAAGGLGYAIISCLKGRMEPGVKMVFDLIKLEDKIKDCDVIFTGEGRIDEQTPMGKTLSGLAKLAKANNVPVIAIAGSVSNNQDILHSQGITSIFSIIDQPMTLKVAMEHTESLARKKVKEICRLIKAVKKER